MAMEIRWDDKVVEVSEDKNRELRESWVWTQVGPGPKVLDPTWARGLAWAYFVSLDGSFIIFFRTALSHFL